MFSKHVSWSSSLKDVNVSVMNRTFANLHESMIHFFRTYKARAEKTVKKTPEAANMGKYPKA